jgi:hypothetical protein
LKDPGFIIWDENINNKKRDKIKHNIPRYVAKTNKYCINMKGEVMEIKRRLNLFGGMFEEAPGYNVFVIDERYE